MPGKSKKLGRLARLVASLECLESLIRQGPSAEPEQVRSAVADLTKRVCPKPPDFDAAAQAHKHTKGITYNGRHYGSYTEILYLHVLESFYQTMMERTTGFCDDELGGYLEPDDVLAKWPEVVADVQPFLLAPVELARLAALAQEEMKAAKPPLLLPLPAIYATPGNPADRWSPAAKQQAARLTAYRESAAPAQSDEYVASDLLTWVKGEPPDRFITKIGGLPYRPSSVPWPLRPSGQPMTFLAQFCFADSTDLVGSLPGDVLLIFASQEDAYIPIPSRYEEDVALRFEWYPLGLEGLVTPAEMPPSSWKLLPCYARVQRSDAEAGGCEGPKIGGTPYWIQNYFDAPGKFLAALGQVRLNESDDERKAGYRYLEMADAGLLNLFLQADGSIDWYFQCY